MWPRPSLSQQGAVAAHPALQQQDDCQEEEPRKEQEGPRPRRARAVSLNSSSPLQQQCSCVLGGEWTRAWLAEGMGGSRVRQCQRGRGKGITFLLSRDGPAMLNHKEASQMLHPHCFPKELPTGLTPHTTIDPSIPRFSKQDHEVRFWRPSFVRLVSLSYLEHKGSAEDNSSSHCL